MVRVTGVGDQDLEFLVGRMAQELPSHHGPVPGPVPFTGIGRMDGHEALSTADEFLEGLALLVALALSAPVLAQDKITLRMSTPASETDQRSVALAEVFAPAVADFAVYEPHWNSSLFKQGTELEAIARGNLEMALASAQELAVFFPEFSIFATGYVHRDAAHQVAVFNDPLMDPFKKKVEDELNMKLLSVMYFGARHVNLRTDKKVMTPEDLAGVNLRMPGTDAWQFLGKALGASPTPMAFAEVYTGLQTGAIDGQDNPLPTVVDKKFYEVTKQIILTSHLVDLNYIAISKKVWDKMTPEQQATVQAAADAAAIRIENLSLAGDMGRSPFYKNPYRYMLRVRREYSRSGSRFFSGAGESEDVAVDWGEPPQPEIPFIFDTDMRAAVRRMVTHGAGPKTRARFVRLMVRECSGEQIPHATAMEMLKQEGFYPFKRRGPIPNRYCGAIDPLTGGFLGIPSPENRKSSSGYYGFRKNG